MRKRQRWAGWRTAEGHDAFIDGLYVHDLHAKRAELPGRGHTRRHDRGLAGGGDDRQALAQPRGLLTKHAIKQVDGLLSNKAIDVPGIFGAGRPSDSDAKEIVSLP